MAPLKVGFSSSGADQGGRRAALLIAALKETFEANGLELEGVCPGPYRPGWPSARRALCSASVLFGAFVWARGALNG